MRLARRSIELGTELGGGSVAGKLSISDGGDGFLDSFSEILTGRRHRFLCPDPTGQPVYAELLYDDLTRVAVIEMAQASGLALVPQGRRDIMRSGSAGLGELMVRAIALGARKLQIGIGGSATCDGGIGMLVRLERALTGSSPLLRDAIASDLADPPRIQIGALRERLRGVDIVAFADVTNPLLGAEGTARTFARQKGATDDQILLLDEFLTHWADRLEKETGRSFRNLPGSGAAGGVGFALAALGARLTEGARTLCDLVHLRERLTESEGLITCEGRFDMTSFRGKAPYVAAKIAAYMRKRAMIACGSAEQQAIQRAEGEGIRIIPFAEDLAPERRGAEAFERLQRAVLSYVRTGGA